MAIHAQWSSRCDLCNNSRKVGFRAFLSDDECPWCRAVRLKYGSYFYPIDKSNAHLFTARRPLTPRREHLMPPPLTGRQIN